MWADRHSRGLGTRMSVVVAALILPGLSTGGGTAPVDTINLVGLGTLRVTVTSLDFGPLGGGPRGIRPRRCWIPGVVLDGAAIQRQR